MNATTPSPSTTPARALRDELCRHLPFSRMEAAQVDAFVAVSREARYAAGETVLEPADGPVRRLLFVRRGELSGRHGLAELAEGGFHYEAGDLFPIGALMGGRPVTATYTAVDELVCLEVAAEDVHRIAAGSPVFADFLKRRLQGFLELSRQALQTASPLQALAEMSLESPLASLPRKAPLSCPPGTPLIDALRQMQGARVGSILAVDGDGRVQGILTRHDVLERVALARPDDATPVVACMSRPVLTLDEQATLQEAALAMSRHGIRHLPIVDGGRLVNIVSERDLFALQKLSLKQVSGAIRAAQDRPSLEAAGAQIRRFARHLMAQGLAARSLTQLLSHLNDLLTERVVQRVAARHGLGMDRACWLAFGSEGRSEQTIATDQDNGLVFVPRPGADIELERAAWLAFAREANELLDACGYPLCKGGVMAGNPACCLTAQEWRARFEHWMEQGAPQDLLEASIYFDGRALAGEASLFARLHEAVVARAAQLPRFLKQMADNALRHRVPLNWRGGLDTEAEGPSRWIDLKLHGTALFVDAARLFALSRGLPATGTRERFEAFAQASGAPMLEVEGWIGAFEYLQMFRLRVQVDDGGDAARAMHPNRVDVGALHEVDRRLLKECLRIARRLQQRLALDYRR